MRKLTFKIRMFFFKKKSKEEDYIKLQKIVQEYNDNWKPDWNNEFYPNISEKSFIFSSKEQVEFICKNKKFQEIYKNILS